MTNSLGVVGFVRLIIRIYFQSMKYRTQDISWIFEHSNACAYFYLVFGGQSIHKFRHETLTKGTVHRLHK